MKVQVEARGAIDIAALTTKALRSCIMNNVEATMRLRLRVKRRLRTDLLSDLGQIAAYGYLFGRELLGTIERCPAYVTNESDINEQAQRINEGTACWEFETVWGALDSANHNLLCNFLAIARRESTLFSLFREDLAQSAFLGMYIFGFACSMSEEAVFGPF